MTAVRKPRRGLASHLLRCCAVAGLLATHAAPVAAEAPPPAGEPREDCLATYCSRDAIYQFGPAAGFAASLYEGPTQFSDVLRLGDFGLGATSPLDGEVIILDGTAYRAIPAAGTSTSSTTHASSADTCSTCARGRSSRRSTGAAC